MIGFSLSPAMWRAGRGTPVPAATITRIAARQFGPGHSTGTVTTTSTGAQATYQVDLVNESGAAITLASLVFAGWGIIASGVASIGNDVPVNGTIEYPAGTQIGNFGTTTVPDGGSIESTRVTLSAAIPVGAMFRVKVNCTIANGLKYGATYLGLCGVNSTTTGETRKKEAIYVVGDSIQTNNGSAFMTAATGRCPLFQHSIGGTRASHYSASFAAYHVPLAVLMGITRFVSNFGTNDLSSGAAALQGHWTTMRNATLAEGILFSQSTITPRITNPAAPAVTSATVSAGVLSVVVGAGDIGKFEVGYPYTLAGANEAAYNKTRFARSVNSGTNTVTFEADASMGAAATGTMTLTKWKDTSSPAMMIADSIEATRVTVNTWVRTGGNIDDFLEWADACEPAREAGRWAVQGEKSRLLATRDITVSSIITSTRFGYTSGAGTIPASSGAGGHVQFRTGANPGWPQGINGNTASDITLSGAAPPSSIAIGDTATLFSGASWASDDGLHPRIAVGGHGGQALLTDAVATWLDARLA